MDRDYETMSFLNQITAGFEDSIAFSQAELNRKTTKLQPTPPETDCEEIN